MEYNLPSELVKDLAFGGEAKDKVISGINKLPLRKKINFCNND